jgi:hypothetical protein
VTTPGFQSSQVRGSGRGLRFSFRPQLSLPVGAAVYRVSKGRRATKPRRVARFSKRRSFRWKPRRALRDGWYVARLRAKAATGKTVDRRTAFRVRHGRVSVRGPRFDRADGCGAVEAFRLDSPVFRGSTRRSLGVDLRSAAKARVTIRLRRGRRTVRTISGRVAAGRTRRLRLESKGLGAGAYTVVATVRSGHTRRTVRLGARAL